MSIPKDARRDKRKRAGSDTPGNFPEFPSEVKILITVMDKNIEDIRTFCDKNSGGWYQFKLRLMFSAVSLLIY